MCIYVYIYLYIIEYHRKDIEEIGHDNSSDMENENERKADKMKEKKSYFFTIICCTV